MNTLVCILHHANGDISTKQIDVDGDITTLDAIELTSIATTYTNAHIEDVERHLESIVFEFNGVCQTFYPRYRYDYV